MSIQSYEGVTMNTLENDMCTTMIVHKKEVAEAMRQLPSEDAIFELANFFKTFGDATRIKIISALMKTELCVCDLAYVIHTSQSAVSHQLRVLRQARLVKFRRVGKVVYYSLDDNHIQTLIEQGFQHLAHK